KLHLARDEQNRRFWAQDKQWLEPPGFDQLSGATLGLVGLGAVGSALATRARMLGMRVHAVRRRPSADPAPADRQWGHNRLSPLLRTSDWLGLAAPLPPGTRRASGQEEMARVRKHARIMTPGHERAHHERRPR